MRAAASWLCLLLLAGCGQPTWADDPIGPLPERLSEVGVYPDLAQLERLHPRAIPYTPRYPLWSNGSDKQRFLILPAGERIDNSVRDEWRFPVGTLFVKTFSYGGRPVETRLIRHGEEGWDFAAYAWDPDGRDATLLDRTASPSVSVEDDGVAFEHEIPNERDCKTCHEANRTMIIGFAEIQLTAGAPSPLEMLADRDVFTTPSPATPDRIEAPDPLTAEFLGYLQGNCVHCHNGALRTTANHFDLRHEVALENLVGAMTTSNAVEAGLRVAPGDPDASVLFQVFTGATDLEMPPVGVQRRDTQAAALFRDWIASLE